MKKLVFLVVFLFLLLSMLTTARETYEQIGTNQQTYALGTEGEAAWNAARSTADFTVSGTRIITNQTQVPLVVDLDQDGTLEIVIYDFPTWKIFRGNQLTPIATFNPNDQSRISNVVAFDIDDDNRTEIIYITEELDDNGLQKIQFLEFDGATLTNETTILTFAAGKSGGETTIGCGEFGECMAMSIKRLVTSNDIIAIRFNQSGYQGGVTLDSQSSRTYCTPKIRSMPYVDHDGDTIKEYIMSYGTAQTSVGAEFFNIAYVSVVNNVTILEKQLEISSPAVSDLVTGADCRGTEFGNFFTSPVVFESDGDAGTLETHFGFMVDDDSFVIWSFDHDASGDNDFKDDFPEACCLGASCSGVGLLCGDGRIISNVMKANAFTDTGDLCIDGTNRCDFCVMGLNDEDEELDLLCGSHQTSQTQSLTFEFDVSSLEDPFNVTEDYLKYNIITHSTQQDDSTDTKSGDTDDLDEFLSSFGVFGIDFTFFDELELIFQNPKKDSVIISVDAEKNGQEDLIVLTSANLFYLDDGFSNTAANISNILINPCIESVIKVNETMSVDVTVDDPNGDDIAARVRIYAGSPFEQDSGFSANFTTGTVIPFNFVLNKSLSNAEMIITARDVENPTVINTITKTFSVGENGVEFGDCTTELDPALIAAEAEANLVLLDLQTNAISVDVNTLAVLTNTSSFIVWIVIMIAIALALAFNPMVETKPRTCLAILLILEILMLILGTILGILPLGIIITIIIVGIIVLALAFGRTATGGNA